MSGMRSEGILLSTIMDLHIFEDHYRYIVNYADFRR